MSDGWNAFLSILKPLSGFIDSVTKLCSVFLQNWAAATKGIVALSYLITLIFTIGWAFRKNVAFWEGYVAVIFICLLAPLMFKIFPPVDRVVGRK